MIHDVFSKLWQSLIEAPAVPVVAGEPLYPSRRIYIAARYSRKEEADTLALDLELSGHTVVSSWHRPNSRTPEWKDREIAEQDLLDLLDADTLISLAEEPRRPTRGGRHIEFGIALAAGHRIIVYGDGEGLYETVFHSLPEIEHCPAQLWVLLNTLTKPGPAEDDEEDVIVHPPVLRDVCEDGKTPLPRPGVWEPIWDSGPIEVPGLEGSR